MAIHNSWWRKGRRRDSVKYVSFCWIWEQHYNQVLYDYFDAKMDRILIQSDVAF